jgi:hypothetical protein
MFLIGVAAANYPLFTSTTTTSITASIDPFFLGALKLFKGV